MTRILLGLVAALVIVSGVQTWRLGLCRDKAAGASTCREVQQIREELRHETDDDLADRISEPR